MKLRFILPLLLFLSVIIILWRSLSLHPNEIPSPLINKPTPTFTLPTLGLHPRTIDNKEFSAHISVVNVWATWCYACAAEHAFLFTLAKNPDFILYGLNYKDDSEAARKWLQERGNPYQKVLVDVSGDTSIDWGVYGAPETFIIDKKGIIRYKQIGPLTPEVWEEKMAPIIKKLRHDI
jgi:cytochrome c biogenesis protein CcmG/thiol:disulfide interchange protein DsbE